MGIYYNPITDIESGDVGRPLQYSESYEGAMRQLRTGEHLYALCDRLIFKLAPCLDDKEEFEGFYSQYTSGMLVSFRLVALREDEHATAA